MTLPDGEPFRPAPPAAPGRAVPKCRETPRRSEENSPAQAQELPSWARELGAVRATVQTLDPEQGRLPTCPHCGADAAVMSMMIAEGHETVLWEQPRITSRGPDRVVGYVLYPCRHASASPEWDLLLRVNPVDEVPEALLRAVGADTDS